MQRWVHRSTWESATCLACKLQSALCGCCTLVSYLFLLRRQVADPLPGPVTSCSQWVWRYTCGCKQATRCSCDLIPREHFAACLYPTVVCRYAVILTGCTPVKFPSLQCSHWPGMFEVASTIIYHLDICMLPPVNLVLFSSFASRHNTRQ